MLPVQDPGDRGVRVADCQAAQQVDGVLLGAQTLWRLAFDRHGQFGDRAAFPAQHEISAAFLVVAAHADADFVQQAAQQLFAVLVGGGRRRPRFTEVAAESQDGLFLLRGQGFRARMLAAGEFFLGVGDLLQGLVPLSLQSPGDQAVVGVDSAVAALRFPAPR